MDNQQADPLAFLYQNTGRPMTTKQAEDLGDPQDTQEQESDPNPSPDQ